MNAPAKWCTCPAPEIATNEEKVRYCNLCGERENPLVFAMVQALAGPLAELREQLRTLEPRSEPRPSPRLVDAVTVAGMVGKKPEWVRRHKHELGAVRLGSGPRPRWGFDPDLALAKLAAGDTNEPPEPARWHGSPRQAPDSVSLLPVKDRAA